MPPKDSLHTSRRAVLKQSATAVAASVGVVGAATSAAADTKDHTLQATFTGLIGSGQYRVKIPDPDPEPEDTEGHDHIDDKGDHAVVDGKVSVGISNYRDKYRYNGDPADVEVLEEDTYVNIVESA